MKVGNSYGVVQQRQTVDIPVVADKQVAQISQISQIIEAPKEIVDKVKVSSDDQKEVDDKTIEKSIEQANKSLSVFDRKIERTVHETTHTIMYVIRDTKTNEVIKEFPPKKIQDMIAKMWELAGLFVDEKA